MSALCPMTMGRNAVLQTIQTRVNRCSRRSFFPFLASSLALGMLMAIAANYARASAADDAKIVAALDQQYQAAVKKNDVATMDRILADDFVLVTGSGRSVFGATLRQSRLSCGRKARTTESRSNHTVWFSDTYVRFPRMAIRVRPIFVAINVAFAQQNGISFPILGNWRGPVSRRYGLTQKFDLRELRWKPRGMPPSSSTKSGIIIRASR
jgi:uncharacterized protein DUF4440